MPEKASLQNTQTVKAQISRWLQEQESIVGRLENEIHVSKTDVFSNNSYSHIIQYLECLSRYQRPWSDSTDDQADLGFRWIQS